MENVLETCKNCEKQFDQSFEFCPHCGQKAKDELTLGVLFYNTIANYFSFDARFFKSFIPLMIKPGYLAQKFVEGKRLLYLHPAQMYLFISVIFFFLFSFISRNQVESVDKAIKKLDQKVKAFDTLKTNQLLDSVKVDEIIKPLKDKNVLAGMTEEDRKSLDSLINMKQDEPVAGLTFDFDRKLVDSLIEINSDDKIIYKSMGMSDDAGFFERKLYKQILKFYKQRSGGTILQAFYDSIPLAMFILLPIFALLLKLFYLKRGSFSHHLVFSFYFFSFLFTTFSILVFCDLIWNIPAWIITLIMLSTFFYLFLACKRFYQQGYFKTFLKSSMVTLLFLMFVIPLSAIIVGVSVFLFY